MFVSAIAMIVNTYGVKRERERELIFTAGDRIMSIRGSFGSRRVRSTTGMV